MRFVFLLMFVFFSVCCVPCAVNASLCEAYFQQNERQHKMPSKLLNAIGVVESGLKSKNKQMVAWPWTLNVEGKGYMFKTKQEAIQAVKQLQRQGKKSIDVGCMQVNLKHHPYAFPSIEQAFEPYHNVKYAATYLSQLQTQHGSWEKAIAYYHSASPVHHIPYRERVLKTYQKMTAYNAPNQTPGIVDANFVSPSHYAFQAQVKKQGASSDPAASALSQPITQPRFVNNKRYQQSGSAKFIPLKAGAGYKKMPMRNTQPFIPLQKYHVIKASNPLPSKQQQISYARMTKKFIPIHMP